jgi:hypothetical protein
MASIAADSAAAAFVVVFRRWRRPLFLIHCCHPLEDEPDVEKKGRVLNIQNSKKYFLLFSFIQ